MPKLPKSKLVTPGGTGASGASKATPAGVSPKLRSFSPLVSPSAIPAAKPKAGTRPNTHPIQRR